MPPSLASRLLFHSSSPPPPVLISPDLSPELYELIALALRAYVSPWWSKLSRYDRDLLPHISHILAHVLQSLQPRLAAFDLPLFLFNDAPSILSQHYRDYRNAAAKSNTSYASGAPNSVPALFAHLQPHLAISHDGTLDAQYYRHVVDQILMAALPSEDYQPDPERIIIRELLVKILIDDIVPLLIQPWFINKTILDLIGTQGDDPIYVQPPVHNPSTNHTFIVLLLSALQSFSGFCLALIHAYKQAISTIKLVHQSPPRSPESSFLTRPQSISSISSVSSSVMDSDPRLSFLQQLPSPSPPFHNFAEPPLILLSELTSADERFTSSLILTIVSMLATSITPFIDKLLPHMLYTFVSPSFVLNITRTAKRTMFPNGYPNPQAPDPSPEEQAELRARLVAWRGKGGIALILPLLLGPDPSHTLGTALDPLSDARCNLHLIVFLFDRILLGLFPELSKAPS